MPISSLSAPFQTSQPNVQTIRPQKPDLLTETKPIASRDVIQFGSRPHKNPRMGGNGEITTGDRFTGAWNSVKKDITSLKWWGKQTAIATAITVATCWLPGSQLFTIPLWLGIDLTLGAIQGFSNPKAQNTQAPRHQQTDQSKNWSKSDKMKGSLKGMGSGIYHGFTDDFGKKALLSGALCLATCWLPGSQLLLIPALFCSYGAWEGIHRGIQGWKHPDQYLNKSK